MAIDPSNTLTFSPLAYKYIVATVKSASKALTVKGVDSKNISDKTVKIEILIYY